MLSDSELDRIWIGAYRLPTKEMLRAVANAAAKNALEEAANATRGGTGCGCNEVFIFSDEIRELLRARAASIPTTTKENERG